MIVPNRASLNAPASLIAVFLLLAGCSKPPSKKDVIDSMVSWIGTGDMATQAWLNHTTFDRYTRETLTLSSKMLSDQSTQLAQTAPAHSSNLDSAVTRARHAMHDIAELVAAKDAPDVRAKLDSLRAAKKIVLAIGDSPDKKQ